INDYRDDLKLSPHLLELQNTIESYPEYNRKTFIQIRYINEIMTTRGGQAPNAGSRRQRTLNIGCTRPSEQMIIRPDGKVSLCCNDALGTVTIGDVHSDSLEDAWNSATAREIRRNVLRSRKCFEICRGCDTI
ncbi:MAG: SPASM domain-containing protein, partial [Planctomycetota bacterium]|nr:SPASM domain-containing protein [Planctomycetota bacterium]